MDLFNEQADDFLFEEAEPTNYAQIPSVNPTLTLLASNDAQSSQDIAQQMAVMGPAYVAAERAKFERNENVRILKGATIPLAEQGNAPAVEEAIKQIRDIETTPLAASYHDDVSIIAEATLERIMIKTGKSKEEVLRDAQLYKANLASRAVIETALEGLSQRGPVSQFAQDAIGLTTVEDWSRLSPVINEELENLGFQGSRSITFASSVNNMVDVLRVVDEGDRGKIVNTWRNRLISAVGEADAFRVLKAIESGLVLSPGVESVFGTLDSLGVAALIKAGFRATLATTKAINVANKIGMGEQAAVDVANKLTDNISVLGVSKSEAAEAAINAKTLVPDDTTGLSSDIQTTLRERTANTLKEIELSLNSGGVEPSELMATKARLERIYSSKNNPSIVTSTVSVSEQSGKITLDAVYGNASGKPFATEEEALNYYKDWKRGTLEVVPVGGTPADIANKLDLANVDINAAFKTLDEAKYAPRLSQGAKVSEVQKLPLFNYAPKAEGSAAYAETITKTNKTTPFVDEVWSSIRDKATPTEQLVVDKLLKTLPKNTKVVVNQGDGTAHYLANTNTIAVYNGNNNSNVFTHELIHAVTTSRIDYGKLNPSTPLGKSVSKLEALRTTVASKIESVADAELKVYLKYLTKDLHEFSTSGLWSINQLPKVAAYLNSVKYKNTTLLSELWKTFKEVLGFGDKDTALSEWFGINEEIAREGLKVTLTKQIVVNGKTIPTEGDLIRIFPGNKSVVVNPTVDRALLKLEKSVANKINLVEARSAPPTGYYVRQVADMPTFTEDIGKISEDELDKINLTLGKLNPRLATPNSIYSPALTSMYKATKFNSLFADFTKQSFDKLNGDSIDKVNNALIRTESLKRDMTVLELQSQGVVSTAEQEAYYAYRTMRNIQHYVKDKALSEYLTASGYNNVFVGLDELGELSGPAKSKTLNDVLNKNVYDVENNKMVTVTPDVAKELDSRGVQIYQYLKAQTIEGRKGSITTIAVAPNKSRVGDIMNTVGKVDGAYARIYTDEYWIKLKGTQLIDDVETEVTYAIRSSVTEKDASAYVKGFNSLIDKRKGGALISADDVSKALASYEQDAAKLADEFNNGKYDGTSAKFNYTRIDDNYFRDVTGVGGREAVSDGKTFWSGRSEEAIKSISTGSTAAEIKGPLASLEAEISNTARFTATNEFRRNAIQRWYNTYEDVISNIDKDNAKSADEVFFNVVKNVKGYALQEPQARRMIANKDFILAQLSTKTDDERILQHAINNLTGNISTPGFAHVGQWLRQTDLVNWAKSTNSTFMLGLFSPAQLVVQASGMLLATTISPKHGLKAAFSIRPILAALTSDNPSVWKWLHKATDVGKTTDLSTSDFSRVAAAIKRVGLLDNIGASSIYNGADGATNIFSKNKAKFNQAQMMFFNKGEEINRVGAFEIARREFIEANPGIAWDTDSALATIVTRADDLSMNMSRVNDARYAQGTLGIPLQFLQHNIRLGTNIAAQSSILIGKKSMTLSGSEALKLTLGSYLLYGINNNATPDFIEDWLGAELNGTLSEQQKQYLTQGVLAGIISTIGETITGERTNIALGSRLSSIQWYEDLADAMYDLFKGGSVDVYKLAGPTGSTLTAALELPVIFKDYLQKDEWALGDFARTVSTSFATLSSTWRNIDKAYWAYHANGMVLSKRGDPLAQLSWPELLAQGLGFQSTEAYESSTVFETKSSYTSTMKKYADAVMRYENLARKAYLAGDIESMNTNYRAASAIVAPLPLADQKVILQFTREKTRYDTVGREAFNKWASELSSHKNRLLVTNPYGEK